MPHGAVAHGGRIDDKLIDDHLAVQAIIRSYQVRLNFYFYNTHKTRKKMGTIKLKKEKLITVRMIKKTPSYINHKSCMHVIKVNVRDDAHMFCVMCMKSFPH